MTAFNFTPIIIKKIKKHQKTYKCPNSAPYRGFSSPPSKMVDSLMYFMVHKTEIISLMLDYVVDYSLFYLVIAQILSAVGKIITINNKDQFIRENRKVKICKI